VSRPGVHGSDYPAGLEREIALGDGAQMKIRPGRAGDAHALTELCARRGRHATDRPFSAVAHQLADWVRCPSGPGRHRLVLVAEDASGAGSQLVGAAWYHPTARDAAAEVAVMVDRLWRNRGLGTALLRELLAAAEARGIHRFIATALSERERAIDMIAREGQIEHRGATAEAVAFRRRPAPPHCASGRPIALQEWDKEQADDEHGTSAPCRAGGDPPDGHSNGRC